jgi:hypothetical protein
VADEYTPIPGTARIHNLRPNDLEVHLVGSVVVKIPGFKQGSTRHISDPIPKNNIPDIYKKMARDPKKPIQIVEEVL